MVPAVFLLVFLGLPLTQLGATLRLEPFLAPSLWQIAGLAFGQAILSVVLTLAIGIPIASVVTRYRVFGAGWTIALITVPFVMPTVVVALAFRALFGGVLSNGLLLVVLAHAYLNLAVVVRVVGATWSQLDDRLGVIAASLGAGPARQWWSVTMPLLRPALLASSGIVFIFTFTSLGIVLLLGDTTTRTLELQVLRNTSVLLDFPAATAAAVLQFVLIAGVVIWLLTVNRRLPTRLPRNQARKDLPNSWMGRLRVRGLLLLANIIVLLPVAMLIIASVRSQSGWTLSWWQSLGSVDAGTTRIGSPLAAIGLSLILAIATGAIAAVIGGLAAISILSRDISRIITVLAIAPLGISAATLGLGTLLAFGRPPFDLRGTGLLIPLAHALVAVPIVVAVMAPALRSTDARLVDVASSLGVRPTRAFWTAYGPVLRVVMLAAGGLACAVSLGEFGAASFLARPDAPTVPIQIARLLSRPGEQSFGVAAVLAVILVVLTLAIISTVDRLGKRVEA